MKTLFKYFPYCFCVLLFGQQNRNILDSIKKYNYTDIESKIYSNVDNPKKKQFYGQLYLTKAKFEKNTENIFYGYRILSTTNDDFAMALKYSDTAIALSKSRMTKKISHVYFDRGNIYYDNNKLQKALDCFLLANKDTTNSTENLKNRIQYTIGLIKKTQGEYKEALSIFKKCEKNARLNNLPDYLIYVFGLAEVYNRLNYIKLSNKYTEIGIKACSSYESGHYCASFISNRGKNSFKEKKYKEALIDLLMSLLEFEKDNDSSNYAENSFYIGECYKKLKQKEKSIEYYKKIDSVFKIKNEIYPIVIPSYQNLINYYKERNDLELVIYYSEQFIKADKVIDDNYKYVTSKIAKNYDIQKVIGSRQKIINDLKMEKIKISLISILLLAGLILLWRLYYLKNKRKKNELQRLKELFESYKNSKEERNIELVNEKTKPIVVVKKASVNNIDEVVVNQILEYLALFEKEQDFLKDEYTVEMLAMKCKTNSTYLSRVINDKKGYTYTNYINKLRIEYILEKLETDKTYLNYSIKGLSDSAGYNNVQTFTRAFINYTKMKPSDFIKALNIKN